MVFLSMVRSVPPDRQRTDDEEKMKIRRYGHLMSKNRLCVALSRQKRLLVIAGDSAMVCSDLGRKAVPELADFLEMCRQDRYGVVLPAGKGGGK